jgi:hypothetical protein
MQNTIKRARNQNFNDLFYVKNIVLNCSLSKLKFKL